MIDAEYAQLEALTVERSNDLVYRQLRQAITGGALHPGQRLVESKVAARLGVSRAPVREAIRALEREGLLRSVPRRGVTVPVLSRDDVAEIYGLRAALECSAVREVARHPSPDLLDQLGQLVARMRRASREDDLLTLSEDDIAFHSAICEAAGNKRLHHVWSSILGQMKLLSLQVIGDLRDLTPVPHRHEAILEAIRSGDMDAAERSVREHVGSVAERIIATFPLSGQSGKPMPTKGMGPRRERTGRVRR